LEDIAGKDLKEKNIRIVVVKVQIGSGLIYSLIALESIETS